MQGNLFFAILWPFAGAWSMWSHTCCLWCNACVWVSSVSRNLPESCHPISDAYGYHLQAYSALFCAVFEVLFLFVLFCFVSCVVDGSTPAHSFCFGTHHCPPCPPSDQPGEDETNNFIWSYLLCSYNQLAVLDFVISDHLLRFVFCK